MDSMSNTDKLFAAFGDIQSQRQLTANYAMNGALQALQDGKYDRAASQLKRVLALTPDSTDAYKYLGMAYSGLGKSNDAIAAYKNAVRLEPGSSSAHKDLGNAYLEAKRYSEAEKEFQTTARIDPTSTYAPYTLGFLYLNTGREQEAEAQFRKVIAIDRRDAHGYYGLGMAYSKMGKYDEAIEQLQMAVKIDKDFALAHSELGKAYAATTQKDMAQEEVETLSTLDPALADELGGILFSPAFIINIYQKNSFNTILGPGTRVADLDPSLATPSASTDFTMVLQFNAEMDGVSVQNVANWSISKAAGGTGGTYNNGITLDPDAEIAIPPTPLMVTYDATKMQATVTFTLSQNETGDGVFDPSHLVFKFTGTDVNGKTMDPNANEFDGFALVPF
ncbi:tetratricopeptide repeat protein [Geotalea toluenoxydans]|uniref:tetratricopeptide repeat protein n=1 Tax=Geotalea toluenoxydans TaxID=421624 RepID=UPI0006D0ED9A|nr:tetratricopeptide repeat protein [Geotalea toluenoxydans]